MSWTLEQKRAYYQANKDKWKVYNAKAYSENKESLLEYQRVYRKENRLKVNISARDKRNSKLDELIQYKGGCCNRCNQQFPRIVYDFHHIDPSTKLFNLGEKMGYGLDRLKTEADKCLLLCANCHRIEHKKEYE